MMHQHVQVNGASYLIWLSCSNMSRIMEVLLLWMLRWIFMFDMQVTSGLDGLQSKGCWLTCRYSSESTEHDTTCHRVLEYSWYSITQHIRHGYTMAKEAILTIISTYHPKHEGSFCILEIERNNWICHFDERITGDLVWLECWLMTNRHWILWVFSREQEGAKTTTGCKIGWGEYQKSVRHHLNAEFTTTRITRDWMMKSNHGTSQRRQRSGILIKLIAELPAADMDLIRHWLSVITASSPTKPYTCTLAFMSVNHLYRQRCLTPFCNTTGCMHDEDDFLVFQGLSPCTLRIVFFNIGWLYTQRYTRIRLL